MIRQSSRRTFLEDAASMVAAGVMAHAASAAPPGTKPLKIGQIGVGHPHAKGKMEVLRNSPEWEVVGVVEHDAELRRDAKNVGVYRDLTWMTEEQLLGTAGLRAVAIETRVGDLLDAAQRCVAAGMHIHLDKPAGSDLAQFRRILADADRQGLTVQMGYMYRYNPAIVLLRKLLDDGWLGDVFEVHAVMSKQVGRKKRETWLENPGGTMFELGCHLIDLLIGLIGKPNEVDPYIRHSGDFDDRLEDNMLAVCTYPRATATIRSTALEVHGFQRRHFTVCGTRGTLHIQPLDDPAARLALADPQGEYRAGYQSVSFPEYRRYIADLADFASIVRGEKSSDYPSDHDLAVQETVLRASGLLAS